MKRLQKPLNISFFILCFGAFLNWMSYGLVYPIFSVTIFHQDSLFLNLSSDVTRGFWLGVLLAASPLAQFFSAPFIGEISDRKGRKPILKMTTLLVALGALISAFGVWERSLFFLIFGRVIAGIGAGNIAVINSAVADFSPITAKSKNLALITMSNGIGFVVGPFVGGKLSVYGFEVPFIFAFLLTLGNFALIACFFSETLIKKRVSLPGLLSRLHHLWKITCDPKFRVFFPVFFIFCFGWSFYWEFIPVTWIRIYGLDVSQIGNFYAFGSVIYVLSSGVLIRPILNRYKPLPIFFTALVTLGVFLFLLFDSRIEWYWINIAIQQFLIALIFPLGTTIVSNLTPIGRQGETLGVFQSLQAFAFASTPVIGGSFLNLVYNSPFLVGGASMFLACMILLIHFSKTIFSHSDSSEK